MNTESKVAIITGASQGIGAGLVEAYRALGYRVVATSRSIQASRDDGVLTIAGDIAHAETAERVVAETLAAFGRIDTLVNNAGIFISKPFTEYTQGEFDTALAINVAGFFRISQLAIGHMAARGSGHVVNMTTSLVDQPSSDVPAVLASLTKGGLSSATKGLAIEYAARGVRVNAVSPGLIRTPMHAAETHEALAGMHPLRRMGDVQDIVDAVIYLETATFVTGEILHVDGGQNAGH